MVTDGRYYGLVTVTGTFGSPEAENALLPATAETNTFGFAASAMSGVLVPVGGAKLDLRGGLNYLHASSDDFTDSVGSRFTDARMEEFSGTLSARLFSVVRVDEYNVRPFVQGGVNHRFHYENEITVDNATFAFDDADTSIFGRVGIDFDVDKNIQGYLAVRGDASEDFTAIAAQVGVTFRAGLNRLILRRLPFLAHGDQFFGNARMKRHGRVEIGLLHAHAQRNGEDLRHLGGVRPKDVTAEHEVGASVDDEFHQHPLIAPGQHIFQRAEAGLIDVDLRKTLARDRFRQPHGADLGLRKHRRRARMCDPPASACREKPCRRSTWRREWRPG